MTRKILSIHIGGSFGGGESIYSVGSKTPQGWVIGRIENITIHPMTNYNPMNYDNVTLYESGGDRIIEIIRPQVNSIEWSHEEE